DHCFVKSNNLQMFTLKTLKWSITDHYSILLERRSIQQRDRKQNARTKLDIIRHDAMIAAEHWQRFVDHNNAETAMNEFITCLADKISQATIAMTSCPARLTAKKPWMTRNLLRSIRRRDKLHKLMVEHPFDVSFKTRYVKYRNTLNTLIRNAKATYTSERLNQFAGNLKQQYAEIKRFLNLPSGNETVASNYLNSMPATEISNGLNDYFVDVGKRTSASIKRSEEHTSELQSRENL